MSALQAITINAARTIELENELGSIKVGKRANFTILAENPLKVKPMHIKDIEILGVVYNAVNWNKLLVGADRDAHDL